MSKWTYVNGIVDVSPLGRTPEQARYILTTVLNHLPIVEGSECCMTIDIVEKPSNASSSHDEFEQAYKRPKLDGQWNNWFDIGADFKLVVHGSLRDTELDETYSNFIKWLTRLAKRCRVEKVLVEINDYWTSKLINTNKFDRLFEDPSWGYDVGFDNDGYPSSVNWCEFMTWRQAKGYGLPMELFFSRYYDKDVDDEMLRQYDYYFGKDRFEKTRQNDLDKMRRKLNIKKKMEACCE